MSAWFNRVKTLVFEGEVGGGAVGGGGWEGAGSGKASAAELDGGRWLTIYLLC